MKPSSTPAAAALLLSLSLAWLAGACRAPQAEPRAGADAASPAAARLQERLAQVFLRHELGPKGYGPLRWREAGAAYTTLEASTSTVGGQDVVRHDCLEGSSSVLVSAERLVPPGAREPLEIEDYQWSADGKHLLIYTNSVKVWRHNTRGDYWVLELSSGALRKLGGSGPESSLMFAKFSPDGTRVAYVRARDLWVEELASAEIRRLTSDGSDTIINGTSDWVYEEELGVRDGFRWSPDGKEIAFWRFDTSGVGAFPLVNDTDTLYPVVSWLAYPKAGTRNSEVRAGIVPAAGGATRFVELPGDAREHYLARMEWVPGTRELLLQRLNRLQNENQLWLVGADGKAQPWFLDRDECWVDVVDDWQWLPSGELLWLSDRDGWSHAWALPRNGGEPRLLTPGEFDLTAVVGVDEAHGQLYFAASPDDATRRYLYRAPLDGRGSAERITPADEPGTHAYDLAPGGRFALHTFSTLDRPPVLELIELPAHRVLRVLESNEELARRLDFACQPAEFFQVEVEPGQRLDGWMLKPAGFDPARRYPLILFVYGEPSAVQATDVWKGDRQLFHRALAEAGYVVACVDNRGTSAPRGRAWRKLAYRRVGAYGAADQAAALRELLRQHSWLDPERVASWGWSGGATMTLHLVFRYPELYRVGLAVAPVPDMTLYDSIYQERYLGLPQDNPVGYRQGSPLHFAEGLSGDLLLVHGTGDDNVHWQGSERLINRLVELGKHFDLMVYPNRSHAISEGPGTSWHVYSLLADYLLDRLPLRAR